MDHYYGKLDVAEEDLDYEGEYREESDDDDDFNDHDDEVEVDDSVQDLVSQPKQREIHPGYSYVSMNSATSPKYHTDDDDEIVSHLDLQAESFPQLSLKHPDDCKFVIKTLSPVHSPISPLYSSASPSNDGSSNKTP